MEILKELLKPRTLISIMLYATFCYLAIMGKITADAILAIVSALMTFYYSSKIQKNGAK